MDYLAVTLILGKRYGTSYLLDNVYTVFYYKMFY